MIDRILNISCSLVAALKTLIASPNTSITVPTVVVALLKV